MKKHLLKLTLLIVVFFSATTFNAQALWTTNGKYKISTSGLSPNLYMTINGTTGALEWAAELPGDDATQVWTIVDHRTPASSGLMEITSKAGGADWTLCIASDTGYPNVTLTVEQRVPKTVSPGDLTGLDQFQRRKAKVDANGLADSGGSNPATGNNALFMQAPAGTNSRYGTIPSAAGDAVQFDGGGIDVLQYHLVEAITASVNTFGVDAFSISNPANNQLTIKGATSKVSEVSLYSVLGNKVLSQTVNTQNDGIRVDVSALATGLYILEMTGDDGERFTKKIVKQ